MFVYASIHNNQYQQLADITLYSNRKQYCDHHGYPLVIKNMNDHNIRTCFEKVYVLREALDKHPDCTWIFYSDCDTLVTNMNTKLEDIVSAVPDSVSYVVTTDGNGINAGNFFLRNSPDGRRFLQAWADATNDYANDQEFVIDAYFGKKQDSFKHMMMIMPQRSFNSYEYGLILHCFPSRSATDYFGNPGSWQHGDFLIHWPATTLPHRLHLAEKYTKLIVPFVSR
jgi:hypothetical protein